MSTKNTLTLIVTVAVLALAGMGAAKFASARHNVVRDDSVNQARRAEGMRLHALNAQHSEALAVEPLHTGAWYGAIPQTSGQFGAAEAEQLRRVDEAHSEALAQAPASVHDRNAQHSEELAQEPFRYGEWYGAIPQTSAQFDMAGALRLRALIEQHEEALQGVAP